MACAVSSGRTLFCFCYKGGNLVSFEFVPDTEPMVSGEALVSRYSVICPVCGERILYSLRLGKVHFVAQPVRLGHFLRFIGDIRSGNKHRLSSPSAEGAAKL